MHRSSTFESPINSEKYAKPTGHKQPVLLERPDRNDSIFQRIAECKIRQNVSYTNKSRVLKKQSNHQPNSTTVYEYWNKTWELSMVSNNT